jgi:hypothetical protein
MLASRSFLSSLIALSALPAGVGAANLLVNPGFDTDLRGWRNDFNRAGAWVAEDANGNPSSGAIRVTHEDTGNNGYRSVRSQCLSMPAGRQLLLRATMRVPAGQPAGTRAAVVLFHYEGDICIGNGSVIGQVDTDSGSWQTVSANATTPPGTRSLFVSISVRKATGVTEPASALIDDVFLGHSNPSFTLRHQLSGAWYNPAWNGQGFFIDVVPTIDLFFAGWYTWGDGSQYQWLTAQGNFDGDIANVLLFRTSGGRIYHPQPVTTVPTGSAAFRFRNCTEGEVIISRDGEPRQAFPLVRLTPPPPDCVLPAAGE